MCILFHCYFSIYLKKFCGIKVTNFSGRNVIYVLVPLSGIYRNVASVFVEYFNVN
jgi:hypothetical protein